MSKDLKDKLAVAKAALIKIEEDKNVNFRPHLVARKALFDMGYWPPPSLKKTKD